MSVTWLLAVIAAIAAGGFALGMGRARAAQRGARLHSRPSYYGAYVLLWSVLPALIFAALASAVAPVLTERAVRADFPAEVRAEAAQSALAYGVVEQLSDGLRLIGPEDLARLRAGEVAARELFAPLGIAVAAEVEPWMIDGAETRNAWRAGASALRAAAAVLLALAGAAYALSRVRPQLRARNAVERAVLGMLIAASTVAILTTFGIVFSLIYESLVFFREIPPLDFFFGTVWDPRFAAAGETGQHGRFGLLPLLWGTVYISAIAMLIAVPIGLLSAIYLSEYASRRVRATAKPALEVLAGIPTIVYGFFALTTVGPLIRDFIALPLGLGTSASSVMTAGVVMGIMIIPFVSSLSDDIINAVPQSLRDGSYALGATQSETIRQVLLPAALPGIVGAVLLAVSRAIGETMIVVLAAGVASRISLNPFQEMTTMTVRIVSQLTGDTEFTSPETLVAFALGLTLFTVTLGLNVYALHIVRKYREQYD